jgi:hypothetical protein
MDQEMAGQSTDVNSFMEAKKKLTENCCKKSEKSEIQKHCFIRPEYKSTLKMWTHWIGGGSLASGGFLCC